MNLIRALERKLVEVQLVGKRLASQVTSQQMLQHRARLFDDEQHRQMKAIERTEKIQVQVVEPGQNCTLIMNRYTSTPYSCALRKSSNSKMFTRHFYSNKM